MSDPAAPTEAPPVTPPHIPIDPDQVADLVDEVAPISVEGEPDATQEGLHLLAVGGARVAWENPAGGTSMVRLRRPTFGEVKQLDGQLAYMTDESVLGAAAMRKLGMDLQRQVQDIPADDKDRDAKLDAIRKQDREEGRAFTQKLEAQRVAWWLGVVKALGVGDVPPLDADSAPAWMVDPLVPRQLLNHFRRVPTVRG